MTLPKVIVHGFMPLQEVPDLSPFVSKVVGYLNWQGWPYELKSSDLRKAPRGKLPYIEVDGQLVTDSDVIIGHLESLHPNPLDLGQSRFSQGAGLATKSMLEQHFYFLATHERWCQHTSWKTLKPMVVSYLTSHKIPGLVAPWVADWAQRKVRQSGGAQGVGRLTFQERQQQFSNILASLELQLSDSRYLGGDRIELVDLTAWAMLSGYGLERLPSALAAAIQERQVLMKYVDRLTPVFFPKG